jgi:hypothetical protein
MKMYLRLLSTSDHNYSQVEQDELSAALLAGPGVGRVTEISRHPRGGYRVTFEVDKEALDALIQYIPTVGYMSVF